MPISQDALEVLTGIFALKFLMKVLIFQLC